MGATFSGFLRRLMGLKSRETADRDSGDIIEYKGYVIRPASRRQGAQWLTAGVITKRFEAGPKQQEFVRADTHGTKDEADAFSIGKARQIIDEQGDGLFRNG